MEAKEFLNQKRIGLVNKFYYQVFEIKRTEGNRIFLSYYKR
jgi:hypothetical protein